MTAPLNALLRWWNVRVWRAGFDAGVEAERTDRHRAHRAHRERYYFVRGIV